MAEHIIRKEMELLAYLDLEGLKRVKEKIDEQKLNRPKNIGSANQVLKNDGKGNSFWSDGVSSEEISPAVEEWLENHVNPESDVIIDNSLTIPDAAADAKATGDLVDNLVLVQRAQPEESFNKLWVKPETEEIQIPTWEEYNEDILQINSSIDQITDDISRIKTIVHSINQAVAVFGDSLTFHNGVTKKWIDYVAEDLGFNLMNYAVANTGYKNGSSYFGKRISFSLPENWESPVVIFGSGTDCQFMELSAGTSDDLYDPQTGSDDTVGGRINYAFSVLKEKAPLARVVIISPCPYEVYPPSDTDNLMIQYCNLLKECTEKAGFIYADMYYSSGLRPWDDSQASLWTEQNNRTQLNAKGHFFLYPQMRETIKRIIPYLEIQT